MAIRETSNCLYPTAASLRAFALGQPAVLKHRTDNAAGEPAARLSSLGLLRVFPPTSGRAGGGASHPTPFPTSNGTRTRPHARMPSIEKHRWRKWIATVRLEPQRGAGFYREPTPRPAASRAAGAPRAAQPVRPWGHGVPRWKVGSTHSHSRRLRVRSRGPQARCPATCADTRACSVDVRETTRQSPAYTHACATTFKLVFWKPLDKSVKRSAVRRAQLGNAAHIVALSKTDPGASVRRIDV